MPDTTDPPQPQPIEFVRHENFESWHANNIQFYPSEWDLKLVFGELDWPKGGNVVVQQHTAMTLSWLQAKIFQYFLTLNLALYEMQHGKIKVPAAVMPPEAQPPTGDLANDPAALKFYEFVKATREQFVEALK